MLSLQFRRVFVLLTTLLVLAAPSLWAQPRGSIRASVLDPLGARVSGATIKLLRAGTVIKDGSSDESGAFVFDGAGRRPVSDRSQRARIPDAHHRSDVRRPAAQVAIDVALPIGPLEQSVSVTAAATGVLPSQIGAPVTVLDAATLDALGKPDVLEALRLMPGVSLVQSGRARRRDVHLRARRQLQLQQGARSTAFRPTTSAAASICRSSRWPASIASKRSAIRTAWCSAATRSPASSA